MPWQALPLLNLPLNLIKTMNPISGQTQITHHQIHSPTHPESAPEPTHSSLATTPTTASSMTICHDLLEQQNQEIWDNYHAIQKQIAAIQATLQDAIDLL